MPCKEPSRTKLRNAEIAAKSAALPKIAKELFDQIVAEGPMTGEQINATTLALKKALIERALGGELSHHLGYAPGAIRAEGSFPIQVKHAGCIGVVTVSGAPQRVDHDVVVTALSELCGIPLDEIALK